jgi:hypothetical protein
VYALTFPTLLLTSLAVVFHLRRDSKALVWSLLGIALAFYGYAVIIGGDFMTMGRVVLPAAPIHAAWVGIGVDHFAAREKRERVLAGAVGLVVMGILPAWDRHVVPEALRAPFHFRHNRREYHSEYWVWKLQRDNHHAMSELGRALAAFARPGDSFVTGVIGNVGYYSDLVIYDQFGLVTPEVARLPLKDGHLRSPGHDKFVPKTFFLAHRPTYWDAALFNTSNDPEPLLKWVAPYEDFGTANNYVPDFRVLDDGEWKNVPKVLCVIRSGDHRAARERWRAFGNRLTNRLTRTR